MTYIDTTYRDVSHIASGKEGDGRFVFLASRRALPLRTEVDGDGPVPDGAVAVQVYRRDTGARVGQFAADEGSLEDLRSLLSEPRRLGMGCREEYPGLVGQLVVLVPASVVAKLFGGLGGEPEEPWKQSLPTPPDLDQSVGPDVPGMEEDDGIAGAGAGSGPGLEGDAAGGAAPGDPGAAPGDADAGDEDDDEEATSRMRFGALPLGNVVRFADDREHTGQFVKEATDMFEVALEGDLPPVSDRFLEELAAEGSPGS